MASTRTKVLGTVGAVATAATLIVGGNGRVKPGPGPHPPDPGPATYASIVHVYHGPVEHDDKVPGAALELNGLDTGVVTDGAGNAVLTLPVGGKAWVCANAPGFIEACADALPEFALSMDTSAPTQYSAPTAGSFCRMASRGATAASRCSRWSIGLARARTSIPS